VRRSLKVALRIISVVAHELAAKVAERFWFGIPKPPRDGNSARNLPTGTHFDIRVGDTHVAGWKWGAGPAVVLMHGWGGYVAQLSAFVAPLSRAGFQVIAFDAPSHGESGPGKLGPRQATLFDFAEALIAVSRDATEVAGVIAHSGGCAAAAWALVTHPKWPVERMVFIAPFGNPLRYMDVFQGALGFTDGAMQRFRDNTERKFGFKWAEFDVPSIAKRVKTPPLLVIHDKADRETSWKDGADIAAAWPDSTLVTTTGLGHVRILREPATVQAAVRFIKGDA